MMNRLQILLSISTCAAKAWDGVLSDGSSVLADARKQGTTLNPGNGGNDECGGNAGASTGVMRGFMDVSCWGKIGMRQGGY